MTERPGHPDLATALGALDAATRADIAGALWMEALDPAAVYEVEDADTGKRECVDGKTLAAHGVRIDIPEPRGCRLVFYKKSAAPT